MTPIERELVVELLRCAADNDPAYEPDDPYGEMLVGLLDAADWLDAHPDASDLADKVYEEVADEYGDRHDWRTSLLEAAQRVEEGSWP